ncbi:MAG: aspartate aminotransferase family protein, partial [Candidatus Nealsonbacteria bacterium]
MTQKNLKEWQLKASMYITGGMSSSFRANQFTGVPMYAEKADGARFVDLSGKEYIDFFMCHGTVLLGHNHPEVKQALIYALEKGFFAGIDSPETIAFAEKVCRVVPAAEEIRFVNSGSEGTLLALRLARGYTGKDKIIRIDGHFHGVHDYLLANNLVSKVDYKNDGNRASRTIGRTAGIPDIVDQVVIPIPWNNIEIMERILKEQGDEIGGIIMNVIDYNNGCFLTTSKYLQQVRTLADKYNVVLIFDEILSGFKTGVSCGQGYYGVTPDICTLGKALTNDVPMGIVVGKKEIMSKIMDPVNPVIAGGTFSGNQLGIAAGNAVMDIL